MKTRRVDRGRERVLGEISGLVCHVRRRHRPPPGSGGGGGRKRLGTQR